MQLGKETEGHKAYFCCRFNEQANTGGGGGGGCTREEEEEREEGEFPLFLSSAA
jgi:hypothetical protein